MLLIFNGSWQTFVVGGLSCGRLVFDFVALFWRAFIIQAFHVISPMFLSLSDPFSYIDDFTLSLMLVFLTLSLRPLPVIIRNIFIAVVLIICFDFVVSFRDCCVCHDMSYVNVIDSGFSINTQVFISPEYVS